MALDLSRKFPDLLTSWAFESEYFQDGDVGVKIRVDAFVLASQLLEKRCDGFEQLSMMTNHKDQLQFGQVPLQSMDQLESILPGVDGVHTQLQEGVADCYMQLLARLNGLSCSMQTLQTRATVSSCWMTFMVQQLQLPWSPVVGAAEIAEPRRPPSPVLVAPNVMELVGAYLRDGRHDQLGVSAWRQSEDGRCAA